MSLGVQMPDFIRCEIGESKCFLRVGMDIEFSAGGNSIGDLAILGAESLPFRVNGGGASRFTIRLRGRVPIKHAYPRLTVAVPQYAQVGDVAKCRLTVTWPGSRDALELNTLVVFHEFNGSTGEFTVKEIRREDDSLVFTPGNQIAEPLPA